MNERARIGQAGEEAAAAFLKRAGFAILERNWRQGRFELDLVCRDGRTLVFVEVRTRTAGGLVSPLESLNETKCRHFVEASRHYLAAHQAWTSPCRFDFVCALRTGSTFALEHYRHVDLSRFVGCSHTAWQPW